MTLNLLNSDIQDFILQNLQNPISKLALQKNPFPNIEWKLILNQIEAKAKSKDKLPTWFNAKDIIYPPKISIEQTSSEKTAFYKSTIVSGNSLVDLSAGFGVDTFYFSKQLKSIVHCEINQGLSMIVQHNFKKLGVSNVTFIEEDSSIFLEKSNQKWDWIYIDPSRRNDVKGKVFLLKDCLPNVPENLSFYFEKSNAILIKTAPLLDISAGLNELKNVKKIHIVAVENEVKELLWELHKDFNAEPTIKTINIQKEGTDYFEFECNQNFIEIDFSLPQKFLYEPNSAIMKSAGFDSIGLTFKLKKLQKHSHLFTSNELIDFPGRRFEIQEIFTYSKSEMKKKLMNSKSNISIRNFPETVEMIRKKWKISDGGNQYCFFTTDMNNDKIVLICTKIN